jgi:thymidylate synthase (FAD)
LTKINARLIALTQPTIELREASPEGLVAFCARVSNPQHQDKELGSLLDYCVRNKHFSIFEMTNAVVEVEAPRDITRQLLRHRSFSFQEFSQRYSDEIEFTNREFRRQDAKNRQNSIDDLSEYSKETCRDEVEYIVDVVRPIYDNLRAHGVAKECARVFLPEGLTMSKLYVNGTLRSWLHYLNVRDDEGVTQWEHVVLARKIREVLLPAFPNVLGVK